MTEELKPLHTPTLLHFVPWHIEEGPPVCRTDDGWILCTASSDADTKRIAVCWNACATIANPDALREVVESLEWIAANYENGHVNHVDFRVEAKHRADAALAKLDAKP